MISAPRKDNIVLGVQDLPKTVKIVKPRKDQVGEQTIDSSKPQETVIKVNNCEIINIRRPRSVTASIFNQSPIKVQKRAPQSVTAKIFAASPKFSSLGLTKPANCVQTTQTKPQSVTSKIFVTRTKEMSKGFLMFSEEEPGLTSEYNYVFWQRSWVEIIQWSYFKEIANTRKNSHSPLNYSSAWILKSEAIPKC